MHPNSRGFSLITDEFMRHIPGSEAPEEDAEEGSNGRGDRPEPDSDRGGP